MVTHGKKETLTYPTSVVLSPREWGYLELAAATTGRSKNDILRASFVSWFDRNKEVLAPEMFDTPDVPEDTEITVEKPGYMLVDRSYYRVKLPTHSELRNWAVQMGVPPVGRKTTLYDALYKKFIGYQASVLAKTSAGMLFHCWWDEGFFHVAVPVNENGVYAARDYQFLHHNLDFTANLKLMDTLPGKKVVYRSRRTNPSPAIRDVVRWELFLMAKDGQVSGLRYELNHIS